MTTITENSVAARWMRRYKLFFLLGLLILAVQIFLAYKSLGIGDFNTHTAHSRSGSAAGVDMHDAARAAQLLSHNKNKAGETAANPNSVGVDDEDSQQASYQKRSAAVVSHVEGMLTAEQLGFHPPCEFTAKETISALQRAKTKDCRQNIARIACAIHAGNFYAPHLPSYCPTGNHSAYTPLGCYRDEKEYRLLSGYFISLKTSNTPLRCVQLCLQSGFPYAGVQYGSECFCGSEIPPVAAQLADSSCNMKCTGDAKAVCGGYFSMNVFETGIAKFTPLAAETSIKHGAERVRIAFLLTLNGRALRQVHRLIRALYAPQHFFYIHVDARQDYLYRQLLALESKFDNIRLARTRFSSIWGGASLLTMLLQCMQDLLLSLNWPWDFVINLSESDFPVKRVDRLVDFLTANRGRNFVKSHGRETQRFIQKQGLDKTFVECDTHMWRIGDRKLPLGIQVDGGSDWVALSRNFIEYVTTQTDDDELLQGLLVIFRHTLLPAESFFHTVLRNSRFCNTYVDNNLHVTNWKRKLGCKCQYKHVVDWCGCSPNDFKPEDWSRLQNTEQKMLFFARKFEPIINQAVLQQLEEWLYGPYPNDYMNLQSYWQSLYHSDDQPASNDDLTLTVAESLMRIIARQLQLQSERVLELTHYLHDDQYKGLLLRFRAHFPTAANFTVELETRVRPVQYVKLAKNSKFAKRLRNFEVSSDFDPKEQVSRNLAKFLGPRSEPVLSFTFAGAGSAHATDLSHSYNMTILWLDTAGRLQDFNELHIEDSKTDGIHSAKAVLKQPLTPGVWTVKLIGHNGIYAQNKFLVSPIAVHNRQPITAERARVVNAAGGLTLPTDFTLPLEWQQYLSTAHDADVLLTMVKANAQRTDDSLRDWVDGLVGKFFHIRETCGVTEAAMQISTAAQHTLPLCRDTAWSSLASDPKSDAESLLKMHS